MTDDTLNYNIGDSVEEIFGLSIVGTSAKPSQVRAVFDLKNGNQICIPAVESNGNYVVLFYFDPSLFSEEGLVPFRIEVLIGNKLFVPMKRTVSLVRKAEEPMFNTSSVVPPSVPIDPVVDNIADRKRKIDLFKDTLSKFDSEMSEKYKNRADAFQKRQVEAPEQVIEPATRQLNTVQVRNELAKIFSEDSKTFSVKSALTELKITPATIADLELKTEEIKAPPKKRKSSAIKVNEIPFSITRKKIVLR